MSTENDPDGSKTGSLTNFSRRQMLALTGTSLAAGMAGADTTPSTDATTPDGSPAAGPLAADPDLSHALEEDEPLLLLDGFEGGIGAWSGTEQKWTTSDTYSTEGESALQSLAPGEAESLASVDPIGHWSFESGNVDGDTVTDRSGNGHDGVINGGVTTGVGSPDAAQGGGATFNGDDGAVVIPDDGDALDPSAFTVSLWTRTDGAGFYAAYMGKSESMWLGHGPDGANPRLDPYDGVEDVDAILSDTAINDGAWHHVVFRHDPDEGVSEIYVDNTMTASTDQAVASPASSNDLAIGSKSGTGDFFSGDIADVRMYDEALPQEDIATLFEGGSGSDGPPSEFQEVAIAPEYSDNLEVGQDAPGQLPGNEVEIELDLSPFTDRDAVYIRFEDYWPSDGWGALLIDGTVTADGETVATLEAGVGNDEEYIAEDNGSDTSQDWNVRFADGNSYWIYEFDVPDGAESMTATLGVANGFRVLTPIPGGDSLAGPKHLYSMPGDGLPGYPRSLDRAGMDVRGEDDSGLLEIQLGVRDPMPDSPGAGRYYAIHHDPSENEIRAAKAAGPEGSYTILDSTSAQLETSTWYSYHIRWLSGGNFEVLVTDPDGNEVASLSFQSLLYNRGGIGLYTEVGDYYVDNVHIKSSPARTSDGAVKQSLRPKLSVPYGFNAGGSESVTVDGLELDTELSESVTALGDPLPNSADAEIEGTDADNLYQSEWYGEEIGFEIDIANGTYDVDLHFAEVFNDSEGTRVFDVSVQGETVAEGYDIYAAVGANTPDVLTVEDVEVTDGTLAIETTAQSGNAKFSGFVVREPREGLSLPYGLNTGGSATDGTATIDGLAFENEPGEGVTVTSTEPEDGWPDFINSELGYGTASTGEDISGTDQNLLYQSEMYSYDLGYEFDVPNGFYDVTLHFSEITWDSEESRVFDVSVQGRQVLEDYDVFAEVGQFAADTVTVNNVEVTDGTLSVSTVTDIDTSKFAGVEIREADAVSAPFGLDAGGTPGDKKAWLRRPTTDGQELVVFQKEVPEAVDVSPDPTVVSSDVPIDGTIQDVLYQTEFWAENLGFDISMPNGNYDVYLHFAETNDALQSEGARVFDISVQGEMIEEGYDIFASVGADTADVVQVRDVAVTDGTLSISTTSQADNTKISGIEVRDHQPPIVEAPYGFNAGGSELGETVEIDGLEFDNSLDSAITPIGDPTPSTTGSDIAGTDQDALYQSEWFGSDIGFEVPLPNGIYEVTLHFSEKAFSSAGSRVFDVLMQGETIEEGYDIYASVGLNTADTLTVKNVRVADGTLSIETATQVDNTAISGVEIRRPQLEVPYGLNIGGGGKVTIDGLTFDNEIGSGVSNNSEVPAEDYPGFIPPDPGYATSSSGNDIAGTDHDLLYQTEVFGPNLGFDFAVPNGTYDVTLHFTETFHTDPGARVFDLAVQGETVAEGYDIYASVGLNTADTLTVEDVEVTDGLLSVTSTTQADYTKMCGIEIRESTTEPVETPYGLNAGGFDLGETAEIDGLVFDNEPGEGVDVFGDPEASPTGTAFGTFTSGQDIEGTDTDALYQTEYFGGDLGFEVALENGTYDVTLHFAETNDGLGQEGARVFDVIVQGEMIAEEYDIYASVGLFTPDVVTVEGVEVTDGTLSIESNSVADNSKISGFEIREHHTTSAPYGLNAGGDAIEDDPASALGASSLADGLEAYYPLEGEQATNRITGNDANATGSITTGVPGAVGDAYHLEGAEGNAGSAIVTEELPINGDGATISLWFNYTSHQDYARIFQTSGNPNAVPSTGFDVEMNPGSSAYVVTWDGGFGEVGDGIDLSPNTWYNMTVVMDGDEFRVHVFDRNGELDGSPVVNTLTRSNTDGEQLVVGAGDSGDVVGRYDEIYAYSRALSETEVEALYQESASGTLNGLVVEADDGLVFDNEPGAATSVSGLSSPNTATTDSAIDGTDADVIYQSEHWGNNLSYQFYIENGTYDVTLHFAETAWTSDGSRVFDVSVQGETIVESLDIHSEVGANTAYTVTVENVDVTNRSLTVESNTQVDNTKFSGIEIRGEPDEVVEDAISSPYGLNTGGADSESEVTIDGLTFANEPGDNVMAWQDSGGVNTAFSSDPVTANAPQEFQTILDAREDPDGSKEVDLSQFLGGDAVQIRFEDHDTSDGLGAQLVNLELRADGEMIASLAPGVGDDAGYLVNEDGSNATQDYNIRYADADAFFTYEFAVPDGAESLSATIEVNNEFLVSARAAPDPVDNQYLYQTEHWSEGIEYEVSLPNGTYDVTLHFAENTLSSEGARVFDAWVQGQPVATDLDIYAEVGANAPLTMDADGVEVTDGTLRIAEMASADNAKISGIEIRGPGVTPPYGFDAGGTGTEGTAEFDGLVLDPDPLGNDDVTVLGDGANVATTAGNIPGTANDLPYQSELWGGDLGFEVRAPNDSYEVRLHFAEFAKGASGERVFDLMVQDRTILSDLDLYSRVGNAAYPITLRNVEVEDNVLSIMTNTEVDNSKISAVEMRRMSEPDSPRSPFGADPPQLLFVDEAPTLESGGTATLSARLTNPYLFTLQDGEVTMEAPGDAWEITPAEGTTFDTLDSKASQTASWDVTPPDGAEGEFTITANVKYESGSATARTTVDFTVPVQAAGPAVIPENPVAYYSLDGDSATNEVTGTDATVVGEPTSGADGIVNSAWEFTTSGDTDSVSDALVSGENLPINGDGATVSAWFNYTEHEGAGRILQVSGDTESPPTNGFNVEMGDDDLFVVTWQDSTLQNIGSSISVEPNTWYNLIVVMDGSEFSVHVFDQDGEIDASPVVEELGRSNTGDEPLLLACGDSSEIAGRIDEVRAYDRALTQFEAADLWEASQNPGDGGGDDGSGGDDGGSDEANVLTNSSFESGSLDGWGSNTWSGQGDYSQGSEAYSGDASAQLSSDNGVDGSLQQTDVPVEPNTDYVLSGWINTENVQGDGHGALLNVQQLAADDVNVMAGPVTGTSDWTQVEWTFNSGENDVLTVNCSLGGWGQSTGTAWFDDLSLVPAGDGS